MLLEEHAARLRALVARDDAAALEHVDEAARARVADTQAALEQRDGCRLRLDDHLDRAVEQRILVGVEVEVVAVLRGRGLRRLEERLVELLATLRGPFFKPWTFHIEQNGQEVGLIQKRWSGFGKELFTDADNFGVTFGDVQDARLRTLIVAATFLLDFVHFENRGN